ncbi:MAG: glycosyl hydrolase [Bacteroidota bacterium]
MMKPFFFALFALLSTSLFAQQPPATPADARLAGFEKRQQLHGQSPFKHLPFRSVGPSVFSGRVVDVDANPADPSIFYAAYATGGLWKTENNGDSFSPLFDREAVMTIGDIAVDWQRDIIWVGTGENNSSRSSYSGVGLYQSKDGGQTWQHQGLPESHHIGRIVLHPDDPNTLWVAVLGHLYSPNEERGVYKTTDGGTTWTRTLYVNPNAGAIDLLIDPDDPQVLYTATWQRERRAWNFVESGEGSGIYGSTDGGTTWTLLTDRGSGFPTGEGVGRIGLALAKKNGKTVLYASLDNYNRRPPEKDKEESDVLSKDDLREMSVEDFVALPTEKVQAFLEKNRFPKKYRASKIQERVKAGELRPQALVEYLEDANALLFDTPVVGAEVYHSTDLGKSWRKTHEGYLDDLFFSYGYYFGQIRVSPHNPDKLYLLGVPVLRSDDGGATFQSINGDNVHVDHHALWLSPDRDAHLILGNDGGVNISYDDGEHWSKCNNPPVGQFYTVAVDLQKPYRIYGGLQDNGVWMGPSTYKASKRWQNTGRYPYRSILGGDGMQVAIDTRDNNIVYTGSQFGNYYRIDLAKEDYQYITPKHELGEPRLRWNWQSPIHLSIHNQDILYMGSNKFHRSMNRGADFKTLSEDLTQGGKKGDVAYGTLTTIHESPLRFGLLYVGSDDGLVHVSKDGGNSWENISAGLPKDLWVTKVQASQHEEGLVYLTLNGYRWDDFTSYLYVSTDYGKNWQRRGETLPAEPLNVVKEDPIHQNLLYLGTDHGLYVSMDRGLSFMPLGKDLPAAAVHDLVVHPREKELVVATHARSFYVGSVAALQLMDEDLLAKPLHLFACDEVKHRSNWGNTWSRWLEAPEPRLEIPLYLQKARKVKWRLENEAGLVLKKAERELEAGLHYLEDDLSIDNFIAQKLEKAINAERAEAEVEKERTPIEIAKKKNGKYYLPKGTYQLIVGAGAAEESQKLVVD